MPHLPSVCLGWALWVCDNAAMTGSASTGGPKPRNRERAEHSFGSIMKPRLGRFVRSQSPE
ncbi:hypothetical protein PDIG_85650 [Penicillium digitatum PHI26]|uniref:Secreted protein n=2 Tax=Penicillium digitatum TaxID=36651 RepID=K9FQH6_PEND2|nr:hypothetical protein PDIP_47400 [Penicillium digitatum Pd1]EKV04998.1 hypothetical protein PDIG_85650 [Penicillium digitatum PHI26]EKV13656.1 hypothetical protein PDIP_47400 [Penicillium digitatum Pd1]